MMPDSNENPVDPQPRMNTEYEDPHYHDEDEPIGEDGERRKSSGANAKKPARKLPPPRRRFHEE